MSLFIFSFALLAAIVYKSLLIIGLEISLESNYFMGFVFLLGVVVLVNLIWLQVNWSLGTVVVVVESKWGCEPLRRSRYLLNGNERSSFVNAGILWSCNWVFGVGMLNLCGICW